MTQKKIIQKIKKLLALGESPNEHEAAMAINKAKALLERHELSIEQVFEVNQENILELSVADGIRIPLWVQKLSQVIAEAFEIETYRNYKVSSGGTYTSYLVFVGFEVDLQIAKHCFIYLKRGIDAGACKKRKEIKEMGGPVPRNFKNSYAWGYISAVESKLYFLKRTNQASTTEAGIDYSSTLPVLKRNEIQKYIANLNILINKAKQIYLDEGGFVLGVSDGSRAVLNKPVSENGSGPLSLNHKE